MIRSLIATCVIVLIILIGAGRFVYEGEQAESIAVVALSGPAEAPAGAPLGIEVRATDGSTGHAVLYVRTAGATHRFSVDLVDGRGMLSIPDTLTRRAGIMHVRGDGVATEISLRPGDAIQPVDALVGPRTIVADGTDHTLAVAVPVDRYGNVVAAGTPVDFGWIQPGDVESSATVATQGGLASILVTSGTEAGTTAIHASTARSSGAVVRISEVPDRVISVVVTEVADPPLADGRTVMQLVTEPLYDRFDNVMLDGLDGQFRIESPAGIHVVPAVVQNGSLVAWWAAPAAPGVASITAVVNGVVSEPRLVLFSPAVSQLPVSTRRSGSDVIADVGPVLDPDGNLVADGTQVSVGARLGTLRNGEASLLVLDADIEPIVVSVLGIETSVEVVR